MRALGSARREVLKPDLLIDADGKAFDLKWVYRNGEWQVRLRDKDVYGERGPSRYFYDAAREAGDAMSESMRKVGETLLQEVDPEVIARMARRDQDGG